MTYEVDRKDVETIERVSMAILGWLAYSRAKVFLVITSLLGSLLTYAGVNYQVLFPVRVAEVPLYAGIVLRACAALLVVCFQYKYDSRCPKCNTLYSMKEASAPQIREVPADGGTRRTTVRHFQCHSCQFDLRKTSHGFVAADAD